MLAIVVMSIGGCSSEKAVSSPTSISPQTSSPGVPAPRGDLYTPPTPLDAAEPGTLIWAEKVDLPLNPPATVWRMLYHSRNRTDGDIAVSGFAVVPTAAAKGAARPIYAWAHGTAGLGDQCAPSRNVRDKLPPFGGQLVERGAVLVATDYEGLGTPGIPTQNDGVAEGRAVLDSVRAAQELPNVAKIGEVVLAGHSQGGAAVLFASEIAPKYAPELKLIGTIALAPSAELPALADYLATSAAKGLILIGASGFRASYPDFDVSSILTPAAVEDLERVESECVDETFSRYENAVPGDVAKRPPSSVHDVNELLIANSPGAGATSVPVFIGHGTADEQVPVALSERLHTKYCDRGLTMTRKTYDGIDHDGVIDAAAEDLLTYIDSRYAHKQVATDCP
jgi:predicted esterase